MPDLYVQKYETSRKEWEAFINETGKKEFYNITAVQLNYYNLMSYPESAAVGITFFEALEYCNWRSKKESYTPVYTLKGSIPTQSSYTYPKPVKMPKIVVNKNADGYRLPEETEWIYFALGGLEGIKSKWWETKPVETYAWVATNSSNLNIRSEPNLQAQKTGLIPKGQTAHIDGIRAPWVKVRLEDGTEGWCFSGYLTARRIYKAVLDMEKPVMGVWQDRFTPLDTINKITVDNVKIEVGETKPENLTSDILPETPFLELYKFGDLPGHEKDGTVFAWNNMNSIIFITTVNPAAVTPLGITIGSSKEEVLRAYGKPFLATKNRLEYDNCEYELVGIIFYFENNKVIRITCFTHI